MAEAQGEETSRVAVDVRVSLFDLGMNDEGIGRLTRVCFGASSYSCSKRGKSKESEHSVPVQTMLRIMVIR